MTTIYYPDHKQRDADECQANGRKIRDALTWFGVDPKHAEVDITESGQAFVGLVEILPCGSIATYDE